MLNEPAAQPSAHESVCGLQALQETFLIFRLAVLLYSYLGLGTRWTGKLIRLIVYSMLLLPGFIQVRTATCLLYLTHEQCCTDGCQARPAGLDIILALNNDSLSLVMYQVPELCIRLDSHTAHGSAVCDVEAALKLNFLHECRWASSTFCLPE